MMKLFSRHKIAAGRVLAILFILANSGFTAVLHQCTMKSDRPMECCSDSGQGASAKCDGARTRAELPAIIGQFTCHTTTIVGGIATPFALLQKGSQDLTACDRCGQVYEQTAISIPPNHSTNLAYFTAAVSPPSVEKCLLNSTLLI